LNVQLEEGNKIVSVEDILDYFEVKEKVKVGSKEIK
jgi:hypothetical protein